MANEKRLIDANALRQNIESKIYWGQVNNVAALETIDEAPTEDAAVVVHGQWEFGELEPMGQPVHCSVCGWGSDMVHKAMWLEYPGHQYCGNCGAKMDGDDNV